MLLPIEMKKNFPGKDIICIVILGWGRRRKERCIVVQYNILRGLGVHSKNFSKLRMAFEGSHYCIRFITNALQVLVESLTHQINYWAVG